MKELIETKVIASYDVEESAQHGWYIIDHFPEDSVSSQRVSRSCDGLIVGSLGSCVHGHTYPHQYDHEEDRVVLTQRLFLIGRKADSLIQRLQNEATESVVEAAEWRERERAVQEKVKELEEQLRTLEPALRTKLEVTETAFESVKQSYSNATTQLLQTQLRLETRDQQFIRLRKHFNDETLFKAVASGEPPPQENVENDTEKRFSLLELS